MRSALRRVFVLGALCVLAAGTSPAQQASALVSPDVRQQILMAMAGTWVGVLEYRDYQSDARVKLLTWLGITPEDHGRPDNPAYGRNILEMLRESRLPGEDFKFRHAYTFTRSSPPGAIDRR